MLESATLESKTKAGAIFHELAERMNKRSVVIVLSDLFDDVDSLMAGLKHFRHRRHDVIVFHVLDPQEIEFSFARPTMFQGLEQMPHVVADPRSLRRAYLREFEEYLRTGADRLPPPRVGLPGDAHRSPVRRGADQLPVLAGVPDARIVSATMFTARPGCQSAGVLAVCQRLDAAVGTGGGDPPPDSFLSRRRYDEVPWAAMEFLLAAIRKHARRWRIEQLLLLAGPHRDPAAAGPGAGRSGPVAVRHRSESGRHDGRHARRAGHRCLVLHGLPAGGCHAV